MAFPTTIANVTAASGHSVKPFVSSAGAVYGFFRESSAEPDNLAAIEGTDPATAFAPVGTNQTPASGQSIDSLDGFQVGDEVHLAIQLANETVYYSRFNMATKAWVAGPTLVDTSNSGVSLSGIGIVVDSVGVITIGYVGDHHGSSRDSIYRARSTDNGATWGTPIQIDDNSAQNFYTPRLILGAADTVHCIFGASGDIFQVALSAAGVAQTFRDTGANASSNDPASLFAGMSFVRGGTTKIRVPYRQAASADLEIIAFDAAADPDTFGSQDTGDHVDIVTQGAALVSDAEIVYALFVQNADEDIALLNDQMADSWTTAVSQLVGTYRELRANVFARAGFIVIGYFAFNNSSYIYNEIALREAPASGGGGGKSALRLGFGLGI